MFVTVTGLKIRTIVYWPVFWWHALQAATQCRSAEGCLAVHTFSNDGFMHTLTAFDTKRNLKAFSMTGAHRRAAKSFRRIATGKIYTWQCDNIPSKEEAVSVWLDRADWY